MTSIFYLGTYLTHDTIISFTPQSSHPHYILLSEKQSDCAAIVAPLLFPLKGLYNFRQCLQKNAPTVLNEIILSLSVCDQVNNPALPGKGRKR